MSNLPRTEVWNNTSKRRYEILVDGVPAGYARYRVEGGRLSSSTPRSTLRIGVKGSANSLPARALEDVRTQGMMVEPRCEFIANQIREHAEYRDLLARSGDDELRPETPAEVEESVKKRAKESGGGAS